MGNVFLHGNGGSGGSSGGMELTVVGGSTRPAKPTQNMIWVNTDKEITNYVFSATEPEPPVEGMAWITIGDSGNIKAVSPVGGDWITVYPLSAKQYIGGAWVDKTAKSYQGGAWVDWVTYLYNSGDECIEITGGWKGRGWKPTSGSSRTATAPTLTKNSYSIKITYPSNSCGVAEVSNDISLQGFNYLRVEISSFNCPSAEYNPRLIIVQRSASYWNTSALASVIFNGTGIYEIPLTGNLNNGTKYDIAIACSGSTSAVEVTVNNIWLSEV